MRQLDSLSPLQKRLQTPQKVVITTHLNPDGDAIGSSLGLYHYLVQQGHKVKVVLPNALPSFLNWLPGCEAVHYASSEFDLCAQFIREAEIIFGLDFGVLSRIRELEPVVSEVDAFKVNIDHHIEDDGFANLYYRDNRASSTAELIYRLIEDFGDIQQLTVNSAIAIYCGLTTDTGSFRYSNTTPKTHQIVSHILQLGVDTAIINERLYSSYTEQRTRFVGYALFERLKILPELRTAYIKISLSDYVAFNIQPGDTEGLVNYTLSIGTVNFGILLVERPGMIRMSFRSKGQFAANEFAAHFEGGGHHNAAGGTSYTTLEETENKLLHLLQQYQQQLDYNPY
jgi:bifunctional oligoribonuclease and PAP phosphatase NrnA